MNTSQIAAVLKTGPITCKKFVFSSNQLPKVIDRFPYGFMANTDPSNKPGTHWVAFYFPSEHTGVFLTAIGTCLITPGKHLKNT